MEYKKLEPISKDIAIEIFNTSDKEEEVILVLFRATYHVSDYNWISSVITSYLKSNNLNILKAAITCSGDIARIYGRVENDIINILNTYKNDSLIGGLANNILADIKLFVKNN